jgi:hypothetical protein
MIVIPAGLVTVSGDCDIRAFQDRDGPERFLLSGFDPDNLLEAWSLSGKNGHWSS